MKPGNCDKVLMARVISGLYERPKQLSKELAEMVRGMLEVDPAKRASVFEVSRGDSRCSRVPGLERIDNISKKIGLQ